MQYIYDGSYGGFLSAVFEAFESKEWGAQIIHKQEYIASFFEESKKIENDEKKFQRVRKGIRKIAGTSVEKDFFKVFLSEDTTAIQYLFDLLILIFQQGPSILKNFGHPKVLHFHQTLKKVNRERHRMQAFIRFQQSTDGLYFAIIDPDFNVLPLLLKFFKNRYTDQNWMIYDVKRDYGMLYNQTSIEEVNLSPNQSLELSTTTIELTEEENYFQNLWKQYFKSTNIIERKNMKLHIQHVPRRYWKYLIEKQ